MRADLSEPWSSWLVGSLCRPISSQDRDRAVLHLIDWMGCATLGSTGEIGDVLRRWAKRHASGGNWACGHSALQASEAIFWNASLGSCHEMDDVHREAVVHPGDIVIPAALAIAQREQADSVALLDSIVIGYETAILLGLLGGTGHYNYWYSTATTGVFGSAMACSRVLGLDKQRMQHALGLAGMQSSGLWQCRLEPGLAKQLAAGHSAQAGLLSADLAAAGMTGPLSILEGPLGWLKATSGNLDRERAKQLLQVASDQPWRLHEVSFKPWSACRHVHPAIECALKLHATGCNPQDLQQIFLDTYPVAISFADKVHPQTSLEGKFSLQHAVAWGLTYGSFGLEATAPAALKDPACVALRSRISLKSGPEQEAAYPRSFRAHLRVLMQNGCLLSSEVINLLGDPENPLSRAQLESKAVTLLLAGGWPSQKADELLRICFGLSHDRNLEPLWRCLTAQH